MNNQQVKNVTRSQLLSINILKTHFIEPFHSAVTVTSPSSLSLHYYTKHHLCN